MGLNHFLLLFLPTPLRSWSNLRGEIKVCLCARGSGLTYVCILVFPLYLLRVGSTYRIELDQGSLNECEGV
jgi:hypothetical protein